MGSGDEGEDIVITVEANICRGDLTKIFKGPIPFLNEDKRQIGRVISVRFDGEYTVGTVECEDLESFRKSLKNIYTTMLGR